jgi:hypothetical protein
MSAMRCDGAWRRSATLAAVIAVVVALGWIVGFDSGALYPIAIGVGTAVAVFSDRRFLRRRG